MLVQEVRMTCYVVPKEDLTEEDRQHLNGVIDYWITESKCGALIPFGVEELALEGGAASMQERLETIGHSYQSEDADFLASEIRRCADLTCERGIFVAFCGDQFEGKEATLNGLNAALARFRRNYEVSPETLIEDVLVDGERWEDWK